MKETLKAYFIEPSKFVSKLCEMYENREGVFEDHKNVEDFVPNNVSKIAQSLFLFYLTQLDYTIKGQGLYQGAKKLFSINSQFFTPEHILELENDSLGQILRSYLKPRYPNEAIKRYKLNSDLLIEKYGGNPLLIFSESKMSQEALRKIYEFRGFGPKIGNLFFRASVSFFKFSYPDLNDVFQPVDIHDVRIAYLLGYVDKNEMNPKNIQVVKEIWRSACKEANANWITFDRALWLFGSEGKPKSLQDIIDLL